MTNTAVEPVKETKRRRVPGWLRVFIFGFILWVAVILAIWTTNNTTLIPSVIFVGSFLTPITFVLWIMKRQTQTGASPDGRPSALSPQLLFSAFFGAGLMGVVSASILETYLLAHHPLFFYVGVGIIEELVKLALVWALATKLAYYTRRDGMLLGATVGFGFAAFESAGYAFNTIVTARAIDLLTLIETEAVRGLLAPVGHGLWTALVGGALFMSARNGKLRVSWTLLGWLGVVIVLHIMWDLSAGLAVWLTYLSTHAEISIAAIEAGRIPNPTQAQATLDFLFDWLLLGACALVGLILVRLMWHPGQRKPQAG